MVTEIWAYGIVDQLVALSQQYRHIATLACMIKACRQANVRGIHRR